MKKQYFKILKAHRPWLEAEIKKGNIVYDTHNGYHGLTGRQFINCGEGRDFGRRWDCMHVLEVERFIKLYKCVYWIN